MPDYFQQCWEFTNGAEGGYTDNPSDPGNWTTGVAGQGKLLGTKFGISAAAYPALDIVNLTLEAAQAIYQRDYWMPVNGPDLAFPLALVAFDAAVNAGVRQSILWLQQAAGLTTDGDFGPVTLKALTTGNALAIAQEALVRRLDFYAQLGSWATFGLGWTRRVIALAVKLDTVSNQ